MSNVVQLKPATLDQLAARINREQRSATENDLKALEHYSECGRLLIEAKGRVGSHGKWKSWLAENTEVKYRQSAKCMQLHARWDVIAPKVHQGAHLSLNNALKLIAKPRKRRGPTKSQQQSETLKKTNAFAWRQTWLRCHPGRTGEEYDKLLSDRDLNSPLKLWFRAVSAAIKEAAMESSTRASEQGIDYDSWKETYTPPDITLTMDGYEPDLVAEALRLVSMMSAEQLRRFADEFERVRESE